MGSVRSVALRSMKAPGTAYDDPRPLGRGLCAVGRVLGHPQQGVLPRCRQVWRDNGGVHIYSGIPNKAFYLAAVKLDDEDTFRGHV
ncbi:M4 family metallopeptidase [Candidatus Bathyarchaeota archaeon]|nr:M4 family metallopeptidase [Candidatus Bathyarchaeota archaeon]